LRDSLIGVDTGAYLTGTLSGIEMPSRQVFSVSEAHDDGEDIIQGKAAGVKMKFWL
jgi:hypothetical protein